MDDEVPKKKGFWGLFRTKSSASKVAKLLGTDPARRASTGDVYDRRRKSEGPSTAEFAKSRRDREFTSSRRRPRRTELSESKGKGREDANGPYYEVGPLTEWPPSGMSSREELSLGPAMQLISRGVPAFKGHKRPIAHASDHYYGLFATVAGNRGDETDAANQHDSMIQLMTLRLSGSGLSTYPWETLEQPSQAFCFGRRPGTITLNHWVSLASSIPPSVSLRDPGVASREVDLETIFARIKDLEKGLEDDDEDLMYRNLYRTLLKDPDKYMSPHKTLDKQITDLILVLSGSGWIDFTNTRNQVLTRFIFDTSPSNSEQYHKFFHQILLSIELDLRINSRHHMTEAKEKLLTQIPPTIQWSLAVARRWRENVRIDSYGKTAEEANFRFKLKRRQVKMLKRFAQMMKWPNLSETIRSLKRRDADDVLDLVSSHAMAFFSGLVLPGPTFPFLIMNTLIDIDPDKATDDLSLLNHYHPSCGFQYRGSYTYWTAASIVGKVIAPTCRSLGGWVGPARPAINLGRTQIARIHSRRPSHRVTPDDIKSMSERSDPLGPPTQVFPVSEYDLVSPDRDDEGYLADLVRIEMLSLTPYGDRPGSSASHGTRKTNNGPGTFEASITFAIDGVSWPLRLAYDVQFISAWPCSDGPHPLFFDYVHTPVKADELVKVRDWNGQFFTPPGGERNARSVTPTMGGGGQVVGSGRPTTGVNSPSTLSGGDNEKVLVVEAFGVPDNEVLARAWCAHWGQSAVVADLSKTCMACAIREAYAATVTVVILVDEQDRAKDD
ncbi:hypothetical protein QBC43DRAFT_140487 [Cladorrhinum sp. PSN259]|nr:hypothetical protein QBC43DRAFT_140487 [Cladorrhinum sp. PSN259]